jgi:hypothetical protein
MLKSTKIALIEYVITLYRDRYKTLEDFCSLLSVSRRTLIRWRKGSTEIPEYTYNYFLLYRSAYKMGIAKCPPFENILDEFEIYLKQSNKERISFIKEIMAYKKISKKYLGIIMGYSPYTVHDKLCGYGKITDQFLKHFLLLREFYL